MMHDAELNQAEQCFYEGFCRKRAVRYDTKAAGVFPIVVG
jgi:hypothetical protein